MSVVRFTQSGNERKWPRLAVTWGQDQIGNWVGVGTVWASSTDRVSWGHEITIAHSNGVECVVTLNPFGPGCLGMMRFPCLSVDSSHLTLVTIWAAEIIKQFDIKGAVPRG